MNDLALTLSPIICKRLNVHCEPCVRARAQSVARISPGLLESETASLFHVLYPSPGCTPMRETFMIACQEEIEIGYALHAPDQILSVA